MIPDEAEEQLWIEVEGLFTLDQYYDSKDKELILTPTRPHPAAKFNLETLEWETPLRELSKDIRFSRKELITESDGDIAKYRDMNLPVPQEWLDYRQALRDITTQPGFPTNVIWPTRPTT